MDYNHLMEQFLLHWQKFKSDLIAFLPKLLLALVVLLIGYLVARLVRVLVKKLLHYINTLINERIKSKVIRIDLKDSADFIAKIFYWIILISTFTLITEIIKLPMITVWMSSIVQYLPNIVVAAVIVIIGVIFGKLLSDIILTATDKTGLLYGYMLGRIVRYTIIIISVVIAIDQLGVDIGFLINLVDIILAAILFAAGLAFGLGAKNSVTNILAAYYVMKIYREGDTVRIGDIEGKIIKITATNVIIDTAEGQAIIPAKQFSEMQSMLIKKD